MNSSSHNLIPEFLRKDARSEIGSYTFNYEEIHAFRQEFYANSAIDEPSKNAALCAANWHVLSVWMKLQRQSIARHAEELKLQSRPWPEFGPSPGMEAIKWPYPVKCGDVVTYTNHVKEIRQSGSKPDWWIMASQCSGKNKSDQCVLQFESSVFLKLIEQ
ncbi:MAG: hypothetical protein AAF217_02685 [Pseudomonadota bacterium]